MNKIFSDDLTIFFSDFAEIGKNVTQNKNFTYVFAYATDEHLEISKIYVIYAKTDNITFYRNEFIKINQTEENLRIIKIISYDDFVSEITLSAQSIKWGEV